jgi:hypothetical protein
VTSGIIRNIILGITLAAPIGPISIELIRTSIKEGIPPALALVLRLISGVAGMIMLFFALHLGYKTFLLLLDY